MSGFDSYPYTLIFVKNYTPLYIIIYFCSEKWRKPNENWKKLQN
jgi:hypothetical protein